MKTRTTCMDITPSGKLNRQLSTPQFYLPAYAPPSAGAFPDEPARPSASPLIHPGDRAEGQTHDLLQVAAVGGRQRISEGFHLGAQRFDVDSPARAGKRIQPLPQAEEDLLRAAPVAQLELQIGHRHLDQGAEQLPSRASLCLPRVLESLVSLEEFPAVELFEPAPGLRREGLPASQGDPLQVWRGRPGAAEAGPGETPPPP